ncbi:MAG TPA: acetyl-CoA carboxylase, carboxyltransferase subunit beta [Candidatus Polarisedimenticolia bacterium]|nr:acetyl-CoA carboxylase, carboxyltransferase subunit beta [Candidatus Polarisedimenticolia bacterium]
MRLRNPFGRKTKEFPSHLWTQCPSCGEMLFNKQLERNHSVCQKCSHHFKLGSLARIELLADPKSFTETDADMVSSDPLGFVDSKPYPERIAAARAKSGHKDAVLTGDAQISGIPVVLAVMDFEFMGGSMGSVVGEKLTRSAERALAERKPLVIVSASGGARMQEGTIALMQLAKTVAAIARLDEAAVPFISVLTDPTTGGVLASFASLGDIILAEPGALIGFSGARVTSETIGEKLPKGFQRSEFLLEHGFVDQVVPRTQLKERVAFFLNAFRVAGQDLRWSL